MEKLEALLRDLITSVDPFASSSESGMRFMNDLRTILVEAGNHGTNSIEALLAKLEKEYN